MFGAGPGDDSPWDAPGITKLATPAVNIDSGCGATATI